MVPAEHPPRNPARGKPRTGAGRLPRWVSGPSTRPPFRVMRPAHATAITCLSVEGLAARLLSRWGEVIRTPLRIRCFSSLESDPCPARKRDAAACPEPRGAANARTPRTRSRPAERLEMPPGQRGLPHHLPPRRASPRSSTPRAARQLVRRWGLHARAGSRSALGSAARCDNAGSGSTDARRIPGLGIHTETADRRPRTNRPLPLRSARSRHGRWPGSLLPVRRSRSPTTRRSSGLAPQGLAILLKYTSEQGRILLDSDLLTSRPSAPWASAREGRAPPNQCGPRVCGVAFARGGRQTGPMRLKGFFGRWSKGEDRRAVERAELQSRMTPQERAVDGEDFEARKADTATNSSWVGSEADAAASDDLDAT